MSNNIGQTFEWWVGHVEDVQDPEELGRARVRIINMHGDNWPTDKLPWASVLSPVTSASVGGVGVTPVGLVVGSPVVGFFIDGNDRQFPKIMGTWHFAPDRENHSVSGLGRGENIINKNITSVEPDSAYAAKYPYNYVHKSRSGHVVEVDDTPGAERIHVYHKSGTYIEINNEGRMVIKTVGDSFDITNGVKSIYVKGNCKLQVDGDLGVVSKGPMNIVGKSDVNLSAQGKLNLTGMTGVNIKSGSGTAIRGPGGLSVPDGSVTTSGNMSVGTGATGSLVAGGKWITFRDGIVTGQGGV